MTDLIISSFYEKIAGVDFDAYGILDSSSKIHTLGTDSKIIGRIFEMFVQPILEQIADENGYILKTPDSQTVYPDFIMMKSEDSKEKIAIDVKTTYIDTSQSKIKFTLGSFGSYMRNNTKILSTNIPTMQNIMLLVSSIKEMMQLKKVESMNTKIVLRSHSRILM